MALPGQFKPENLVDVDKSYMEVFFFFEIDIFVEGCGIIRFPGLFYASLHILFKVARNGHIPCQGEPT